MTDMEKLVATFKELGIEHTVEVESGVVTEGFYTHKIVLGNGVGYTGFECEYYFHEGTYIAHGIWE